VDEYLTDKEDWNENFNWIIDLVTKLKEVCKKYSS